jgi:hypothetical protein
MSSKQSIYLNHTSCASLPRLAVTDISSNIRSKLITNYFPFLNYPTIILNFQATQLLNLRHAFKDTHNLYQVSRWFCQHPRTVLRPLSVYSSNTTATTTSHTSVETPGTSDCKLCFSKCRPQGGDRLHPRTGEERGVSSQWIFD